MGAALLLAATPSAAQPRTAETAPAIPSSDDAPIAYLIDATSGQVLFSRDPDRRFMPASITKTMTAFLAFEWMEEGRLFPQQVYTVRPETFRKWNRVGSTMFLPQDARVTVDDLLHGVTTISANDGAVVLAEGAAGSLGDWLAAMNAKAQEIGMADSYFGTPNGWMDEGHTFVTAHDLALLGRTMIARHPSKYRHFFGAEGFEYNGIAQRNHDPITGVVRGADGIKSGFTNQAGYGFLGSAQRNGQRLIMVVAGSPTGKARNKASRELMEWGFAAFESEPLVGRGKIVGTARVQDGASRAVGLQALGPVRVAIPNGRKQAVSLTIAYEGPLQAPIAKGEEIAELVISIDGMPESRVPLVAESDVAEANPLQRIANGILGWFS
ncbi:D-alanyl-D-alanine carboxypeptidase [Qipengyuania sp. 6B39]|nr:D-alanyl-D-alanine carboxypeptidase [Qipengyuania proteolytica]